MKLDRLIGILSILLQGNKVTMPYLAETFEVSRRTISRDIEALCRAGIPIRTSQGSGGGLSIMSRGRVDRALLTSGEMQAILAGLKSLDSVSGTHRYRQLMEKLAGPGMLAQEGCVLIDLAAWHKGSLSGKIDLLQEAIPAGREVSFQYFSPAGESRRAVEPYYILFQWGAWYLWGWCGGREDYRLFKLDRMAGLSLGAPFAKRQAPYPDLSDERVFPQRYQVEALVPARYKWLLVEEYGEKSFTVEPDGRCRFSIGFTHLDSAVGFLLSFRGDAQVLGPGEVREALGAVGKKLTESLEGT